MLKAKLIVKIATCKSGSESHQQAAEQGAAPDRQQRHSIRLLTASLVWRCWRRVSLVFCRCARALEVVGFGALPFVLSSSSLMLCVGVSRAQLFCSCAAFGFRGRGASALARLFGFCVSGVSGLRGVLVSAVSTFRLSCKYLRAQLLRRKVCNSDRTRRCTRPLKAPFNLIAHRLFHRGAFSGG